MEFLFCFVQQFEAKSLINKLKMLLFTLPQFHLATEYTFMYAIESNQIFYILWRGVFFLFLKRQYFYGKSNHIFVSENIS